MQIRNFTRCYFKSPGNIFASSYLFFGCCCTVRAVEASSGGDTAAPPRGTTWLSRVTDNATVERERNRAGPGGPTGSRARRQDIQSKGRADDVAIKGAFLQIDSGFPARAAPTSCGSPGPTSRSKRWTGWQPGWGRRISVYWPRPDRTGPSGSVVQGVQGQGGVRCVAPMSPLVSVRLLRRRSWMRWCVPHLPLRQHRMRPGLFRLNWKKRMENK
jgi:hypothetical protein